MMARLSRFWFEIGVALAVACALVLPLNLLSLQPLHHDEALYATWAQAIATGDDPGLSTTPIDKPPIFLYVDAAFLRLLGATPTAARLPSLLAGGAVIVLTALLGRRLYGPAPGVLAAWLAALSPFALMFWPTAFTDPLLVALVLAAALAAGYRRAVGAGVLLGLAAATKQQGVFFAPLVAGILLLPANDNLQPSSPAVRLARLALGFALVLAPAFVWDAARSEPSGFLQSSFTNYGGLALDLPGAAERWRGFAELLGYGTASPLLNGIFLAGLPLLLLFDGWVVASRPVSFRRGPALADGLLALFVATFLLLHTVVSFQVWDRYLLGLIPLLALLLARILLLPWVAAQRWVPARRRPLVAGLLAAGLIVLLPAALLRPVQDAANARYPLGSNSNTLRGIEQITAWLQGHDGANTTLYHRWLGTHWRFYLRGWPYDLQFWDTPDTLAARAQSGHLIAFPATRSQTEARLALRAAGFHLQEVTRSFAPNGAPSIILYRITANQRVTQ